ncbi:MAG: type II toxin-antitoxin system prevent-host-death family antitoxin [Eggerthellaceae bacterium]|nr:type II toxin-antitoxin system prevent-host-death family antitoxin [Eggerthellaceae bacterium]
MDTVSLYDAKANLSKLVERAQRGETIVITKHGKPAACVMPVEAREQADIHRTGFFKGRYEIPDGFDTVAQEEIIALFNGGES